jgi:hypothetical protein
MTGRIMTDTDSRTSPSLRIMRLAIADRAARAGLGFALVLGFAANGALHAGNFQQAAAGSAAGAVGIATAVQALGIVMAAPLLKLLSIRRVTPNLALISAVLALSGFLGVFFLPGFAGGLAARFTLGAGVGLGMTIAEYLAVSRPHAALRPVLATAFGVLLAAGHALGTLLTSTMAESPLVLFSAFLLACSALAAAPWGRLPQPQHRQAGSADFHRVMAVSPAVFLAAALFGFLDNGLLTMLPDFMAEAGIGRADMVATSFAAFAGICLLQVPAGWLCLRFDPMQVLRAAVLALIAGIMILALTVSAPGARAASVFFLGGLVDVLYTVGLLSLAAHMPRGQMAAANACFVSLCGVGEVAGPLVTGPGLERWGLAGGLTPVLYLLVIFWLVSAWLSARPYRAAHATGAQS